jgi:hypothetical protein
VYKKKAIQLWHGGVHYMLRLSISNKDQVFSGGGKMRRFQSTDVLSQ